MSDAKQPDIGGDRLTREELRAWLDRKPPKLCSACDADLAEVAAGNQSPCMTCFETAPRLMTRGLVEVMRDSIVEATEPPIHASGCASWTHGKCDCRLGP